MGDFTKMTGTELVQAYNALAGLTGDPPRKAKFHDRSEGIARCQALQEKLPQLPESKPPPTMAASVTPSRHRLQKVIRLTQSENPHRPGTRAHEYYEGMKDAPTIGQFLDKFEDRDDANLYLWMECRNGNAKVLG